MIKHSLLRLHDTSTSVCSLTLALPHSLPRSSVDTVLYPFHMNLVRQPSTCYSVQSLNVTGFEYGVFFIILSIRMLLEVLQSSRKKSKTQFGALFLKGYLCQRPKQCCIVPLMELHSSNSFLCMICSTSLWANVPHMVTQKLLIIFFKIRFCLCTESILQNFWIFFIFLKNVWWYSCFCFHNFFYFTFYWQAYWGRKERGKKKRGILLPFFLHLFGTTGHRTYQSFQMW